MAGAGFYVMRPLACAATRLQERAQRGKAGLKQGAPAHLGRGAEVLVESNSVRHAGPAKETAWTPWLQDTQHGSDQWMANYISFAKPDDGDIAEGGEPVGHRAQARHVRKPQIQHGAIKPAFR